jgi:FkbM family methyltransferase
MRSLVSRKAVKRYLNYAARQVAQVARLAESRTADRPAPVPVPVQEAAPALASWPEGAHPTYSHWGEDRVVMFLLNDKRDGFYVDVGCYHPVLYSNTKLLFDAGWKGVNIDPNPFMIDEFKKARPNDVNLHLAVSDVAGVEIDFFLFDRWASSNTASSDFARTVTTSQNVPVRQTLRVKCETLQKIFTEHCIGRTIDFLNVDVEALDLKVLVSNDWERFRPKVVAVEDFEFDYQEPARSAIATFLFSKRYRMVSRNIYSNIFVAEESGIALYRT